MFSSSILEMALAVDRAKDEGLIKPDIDALIEKSTIIINKKTTVLITPDGKKTTCRPSKDEEYDKETGIAMCFIKYLFGSRHKFLQFVDKAKVQTFVFTNKQLKQEVDFMDRLKFPFKAYPTTYEALMRVDRVPTTTEEVERMANLIYIVNMTEVIIKRPILWRLIMIDNLSNNEVKELADNIRNADKTDFGIYRVVSRFICVRWYDDDMVVLDD